METIKNVNGHLAVGNLSFSIQFNFKHKLASAYSASLRFVMTFQEKCLFEINLYNNHIICKCGLGFEDGVDPFAMYL